MRIGEELMRVRETPLDVPLFARHLAQLLDAAERKDDA